MEVELLYFEGCPNWQVADGRLAELAKEFGFGWRRTDVARDGAPVDPRFRGSPTILMDGRDPFPGAAPTLALSCRLYPTPDGLSGSPTVAQLRAALQNVAA